MNRKLTTTLLLAAVIITGSAAASAAGDFASGRDRVRLRHFEQQAIAGNIDPRDVAVASDGVNFLIVWSEGFDHVLHAMLVGPRGQTITAAHRLSTGIEHARPAVAWTGESYVIVSIDMHPPRRVVTHRVDANGQLITAPPSVIMQETYSSVFPEYAAVRIGASSETAFAWWSAITNVQGTLGLGVGLTQVDANGAPLRTLRPPNGEIESIAVRGDETFLGQSITMCSNYTGDCWMYGNLIDAESEATKYQPLAEEINPPSLAASRDVLLYLDKRGYPATRQDGVTRVSDTMLTKLPTRAAWTGNNFLSVWPDLSSCRDGVCGLRPIRGAWITPDPDNAPDVSAPFTIAPDADTIAGIAGNNRGAALVLFRSPDRTLQWVMVQRSTRERGVRR